MIETFKKGESYIVQISDNAGGIPDAYIETIFDSYFSTKDEKTGTGLGLYMSKIIIEEHHEGTLSVKNNEHGATFIIEVKSDIIEKLK